MNERSHKFEAAGLGKAPFRLIDVYEKRGPLQLADGTLVGAPGQPMGTCRYCGTGIAVCCVIQDAEGATFEVGSECVKKRHATDAADTRLELELRSRKNDLAREKRRARGAEARKRLQGLIARHGPAMSARPHPYGFTEYGTGRPLTFLDYLKYSVASVGATNIVRLEKAIRETYEGEK